MFDSFSEWGIALQLVAISILHCENVLIVSALQCLIVSVNGGLVGWMKVSDNQQPPSALTL